MDIPRAGTDGAGRHADIPRAGTDRTDLIGRPGRRDRSGAKDVGGRRYRENTGARGLAALEWIDHAFLAINSVIEFVFACHVADIVVSSPDFAWRPAELSFVNTLPALYPAGVRSLSISRRIRSPFGLILAALDCGCRPLYGHIATPALTSVVCAQVPRLRRRRRVLRAHASADAPAVVLPVRGARVATSSREVSRRRPRRGGGSSFDADAATPRPPTRIVRGRVDAAADADRPSADGRVPTPDSRRYVHKHHHRQNLPERGYLDAGNEHPIEQVLGLSCLYATLVLVSRVVGLHAVTILVHFLLYAVLALLNHTAYDVEFAFWGFEYTVRAHETHHRYPTKNLAQYFMFWDKLYGTYKPYYDGADKRRDGVVAKGAKAS